MGTRFGGGVWDQAGPTVLVDVARRVDAPTPRGVAGATIALVVADESEAIAGVAPHLIQPVLVASVQFTVSSDRDPGPRRRALLLLPELHHAPTSLLLMAAWRSSSQI